MDNFFLGVGCFLLCIFNASSQEMVEKVSVSERGSVSVLTEQADIDLFTKGKEMGNVGDDAKRAYRRVVQRTIMPTEPTPSWGAILTFDDQLVSKSEGDSQAMEVARDLQKVGARCYFFANVPGVSLKTMQALGRLKMSDAAKKKRCGELLERKRKEFVGAVRALIALKNEPDAEGKVYYTCEVCNHTAFHQDMSQLRVGTVRFEMCLMGVEFIESCLDEAYEAERPGWKRARYFRFPFLHVPKGSATLKAVNAKFTELGLVSVGETQDSKDVQNLSADEAYRSLAAAKIHRCYNPARGGYCGETERPIALFHTRTWEKLKEGILKAITERDEKVETEVEKVKEAEKAKEGDKK